MCKQAYDAWRVVGHDVDVTAGPGEEETPIQLDRNNGDVIGFSIGENYERVDLGKCLLSLEVEGKKVLEKVPVTQLIPDGERHIFPVEISAGLKLRATLLSRSANTVVDNPIVLMAHYKNPDTCK